MIIVIATVVALAGLPVAAADAEIIEAPIPVPAFEFVDGYDWSARTHATHLVLDATPIHSVLDATEAKPWIDLEISGLQPYQAYEIASADQIRLVHASHDGVGIAWNVPNMPREWILTHARTGFILGSFTVDPNPEFDPDSFLAPRPASCCCAEWRFWDCASAEPPKPTRTEPVLEAWAPMHMILPFADGVEGTLTGSSERAVKVGVVVKGTIAGNGGTAGGELAFTRITESAFTTLEPAVYEAKVELQKDVYEDESYKIYAIRATQVKAWNPYRYVFQPPPDAIIEEINVEGKNLEMGYSQEARGALQVGMSAFGEKVSVTFQATGAEESKVRMSVPSPPVGSKWAFWLGNGQGYETGMIAAVWQLE